MHFPSFSSVVSFALLAPAIFGESTIANRNPITPSLRGAGSNFVNAIEERNLGTEPHDNYIWFNKIDDAHAIQDITCKVSSFEISPKQPYDGYSCGVKDGNAYVLIKAGRHQTQDVANKFNQGLRIDQKMIATYNMVNGQWPEAMNFFATMDIEYTLASGEKASMNQVRIGQASKFLIGNYWWFGGSSWTWRHSESILSNGVLYLTLDSHDSFKLGHCNDDYCA